MANPGSSVAPAPIEDLDNFPSNVDMVSAKREEGVEVVVALEGGLMAWCRATAEAEVGVRRFSNGGGVTGREVEVTMERGRRAGLVFSFG